MAQYGSGTLGLNLGLGAPGRRKFRKAAATGNLGGFVQRHPGVGRRLTADVTGGNQTLAGNAGAYINQNNMAGAGGLGHTPPGIPAAPGGGAPGGIGGPPAPAGPAPATPGAPTTPPTFQDLFTQQFGVGNPYGSPTFQNFSDLQNAVQAHANQELNKNLAQVRARFAGQGLGTGSREALAEGAAVGESQAAIEDTLAQLANQARTGDLDRSLAALGLSSQTSLAEQKLPLEALQMLLGAGDTLYSGARADLPRLIDLILPFLTGFGRNQQQASAR